MPCFFCVCHVSFKLLRIPRCFVLCLSPATVFNNANQNINVYGDDVEVDYRGYEVSDQPVVQ